MTDNAARHERVEQLVVKLNDRALLVKCVSRQRWDKLDALDVIDGHVVSVRG